MKPQFMNFVTPNLWDLDIMYNSKYAKLALPKNDGEIYNFSNYNAYVNILHIRIEIFLTR